MKKPSGKSGNKNRGMLTLWQLFWFAFAMFVSGYATMIFRDWVYAKDFASHFVKLANNVATQDVADAISYANQLGRLDLVSILLGILSIVLGLGAIFGFLHIREASNFIARNEAEKWLDDCGPKEVTKWLELYVQKNPELIKELILKSLKPLLSMTDSSAEEIAKSYEQQTTDEIK